MGRTFWTLHTLQVVLLLHGSTGDSSSGGNSGGSLPRQTPYLLEIVTGRCYDRPPTGHSKDADRCPVIAPGLIAILQGSKDEAISVESFESYWNDADFSTLTDHALLVMDGEENRQLLAGSSRGDDDTDPREEDYFLPPSLIRPESTPGGALLNGLVFCGVDEQHSGCDFAGAFAEDNDGSVRFQGAQTAFWAGVYRSFAASVSGKLRIVVLGADEADVEEERGSSTNSLVSQETVVKNQLVLLSAIPNLPIHTEVEVFSQCSCERPIVAKVMKALEEHGMKSSCTYDRGLMHLFRSAGYFIGDDPFSPLSASSSVVTDDDPLLLKRKGRFHVLRSAAVGVGMILTAAATMLLGMTLHSKRADRGRYDKIPTDILLQ